MLTVFPSCGCVGPRFLKIEIDQGQLIDVSVDIEERSSDWKNDFDSISSHLDASFPCFIVFLSGELKTEWVVASWVLPVYSKGKVFWVPCRLMRSLLVALNGSLGESVAFLESIFSLNFSSRVYILRPKSLSSQWAGRYVPCNEGVLHQAFSSTCAYCTSSQPTAHRCQHHCPVQGVFLFQNKLSCVCSYFWYQPKGSQYLNFTEGKKTEYFSTFP
jgi:hypothetical protein